MAFGTDGVISRTTSNTVQVANKEDGVGTVIAMETYGGVETVTEEDYVGASFTNEAVNGQSGTSSAAVVTRHDEIEGNTEFSRSSKESQKPLAAPA